MSADEEIEAIIQVDISVDATTRCLLCGRDDVHRHNPVEIVCYRNGIKRGLGLVTAERDALAAGLRLYHDIPVVPSIDHERHGYNCAGCGAPLADEHADDCVWRAAMNVLRAHPWQKPAVPPFVEVAQGTVSADDEKDVEIRRLRLLLVFADGLAVSQTGHSLADLYAADCQWAQTTLGNAGCYARTHIPSGAAPPPEETR